MPPFNSTATQAHTTMTLVQLVSLQLMLYAPLWLLAAGVFRDERPAVWHWFGYALTAAGAMALLASRSEGPNWANTSGASLSVLLSLILARRGVELFLHLRPSDREFTLLLLIAAAGLSAIGVQPEQAWLRSSLTSALCAVLLLSALWRCWRALVSEFSLRLALAAALPVLAMLIVHLLQVLAAWRQPETLRITAIDASLIPARVWLVVLASAAAFNYLFLFLVALRLVNKLSHQARHDPLTGLLNRRAMQHVLAHEWARYQHQATAFTLLSVDIDHFKQINDQHGHDTGDAVLQGVAEVCAKLCCRGDVVARYGGEEFLVLMRQCSLEDAREQAQRLRQGIAGLPFSGTDGKPLRPVTASFGVTVLADDDTDVQAALARADAALYGAKRAGRDCVMTMVP